jgi:hypothetical protein
MCKAIGTPRCKVVLWQTAGKRSPKMPTEDELNFLKSMKDAEQSEIKLAVNRMMKDQYLETFKRQLAEFQTHLSVFESRLQSPSEYSPEHIDMYKSAVGFLRLKIDSLKKQIAAWDKQS